eukprot:COSAG01_NODE_75505_length_195_cov_70.489583_1_plen_61_part_01
MHVVDDECRSAWSLGEIVQVGKAFQFDHISQQMISRRNVATKPDKPDTVNTSRRRIVATNR